MTSFWSTQEAAQADYEALRRVALAGGRSITTAASRFERIGLAGLILRPVLEPDFNATIIGASRPSWTPYRDPRQDAIGDAYELLLSLSPGLVSSLLEVQR
jgi:hypothetical protein